MAARHRSEQELRVPEPRSDRRGLRDHPRDACKHDTDLPSNEHPNQHDFEQIGVIYRHLDSTTTVGAATPGPGAAADVDHPPQWGRLVRSNRNGRVQVYERDFGQGHKVITHVFWADPEGDARGRR